MDRFRTTLAALIAARRSVPIALVAGSLIATQLYYARDPRAALVPVGMAAGFVALGPWTWRLWLGARARRSVTGAACYAVVAVAVVVAFGVGLPRLFGLGPTFLTDPGSLVVAGVLYGVGGWGLGRDLELEDSFEDARLKAIRAHLDPHFLYNTLNAIAEWCAEDPKVAEEATLRLASMLRDLHDGLECRTWPLARELALAEDLLELHRIRDAEAFTLDVAVDPHCTAIDVAPLVLVTLVENAVKHGPRRGHRGSIAIRIAPSPAGVRCEVENPGSLEPTVGMGTGLATLRTRLAHAYDGRARFAIVSIAGDRTLATLELPRGRGTLA